MTTAAAIDRLVHHSVIIKLAAQKSFRADAARERNGNHDDNYGPNIAEPSATTGAS